MYCNVFKDVSCKICDGYSDCLNRCNEFKYDYQDKISEMKLITSMDLSEIINGMEEYLENGTLICRRKVKIVR